MNRSFVNETDCTPGGGIAKIRTVGTADQLGNGSYDQFTIFEDGSQRIWHFSYVTSADFLTTSYTGESDDGSETYLATYTYRDETSSTMQDVWNKQEGTYANAGVVGNDGSYDVISSFDDPATQASPDWSMASTSSDVGFAQDVHYVSEEYVSDYTYVVDPLGNSEYVFATDMIGTEVNPDFVGEYRYAADLSGSGAYTQAFDDGSSLLVNDIINADGSSIQSWQFDDASTEQALDQEGNLVRNVDGSAQGTVTTHVVGGALQTCDLHVSVDGVSTIDNCR